MGLERHSDAPAHRGAVLNRDREGAGNHLCTIAHSSPGPELVRCVHSFWATWPESATCQASDCPLRVLALRGLREVVFTASRRAARCSRTSRTRGPSI